MAAKAAETTIEAVAHEAGLTRNSYNSLKKNGVLPRADVALKMARALNVPIEYLLTGVESSGTLPQDVNEIVAYLLTLKADDRRLIAGMIKSYADNKLMQNGVVKTQVSPDSLLSPKTHGFTKADHKRMSSRPHSRIPPGGKKKTADKDKENLA